MGRDNLLYINIINFNVYTTIHSHKIFKNQIFIPIFLLAKVILHVTL